MFIGKLVRGIKGQVLPVIEQDNADEPIGVITDFITNYDGGIVIPVVLFIGDKNGPHGVHPDNIQELN
jgi:hypothetical protein